MAKSNNQRRQQHKWYGQERRPKAAAFIGTLMQRPDSVPSKERIGVAYIPGVDLLTPETSFVDLLSHDMLHEPKRSKQNSRDNKRDFVQRHNGQF
jgi:hypothetical protein